VVGCWAHLRRKFDEAVKSLPQKDQANAAALQGQAYCSRLFSIEQELAELPPEEQYTQRLERSKPVMDALLAWAETTNAAPKSALGKAIYYLKEQWPYLIRVLVTAYEFYREIFPVGSFERKGVYEDQKGNGIAVTIPPKGTKGSKGGENGITLEIEGDGRAKRYTITDDLATLPDLQDTDFTIMSPISYFGNRRSGKNARFLYALVFDLDGVGMPQLRDTLHQMESSILPKATFVVNSGTGLHLYYVLDKPVPMYPQNQKYLKELKYSLTRQIWNKFTSTINKKLSRIES